VVNSRGRRRDGSDDLKWILRAFGAGFLVLAGLNLGTAAWLNDRIDDHEHGHLLVETPEMPTGMRGSVVGVLPPPTLTEADVEAIVEAVVEAVAERLQGEEGD